jgi:PAS domain S-box-containing protein
MNKADSKTERPTSLRNQAAEFLQKNPDTIKEMPPQDKSKLIEELQIYQVELEMQNKELRRTQVNLTESRDRYSDLYEFAPVGYVTLSYHNLIVDANLTFVKMLGIERRAMMKQRFSTFIIPDDQDIFYRHRREILNSKERESCMLRLRKRDDSPLWVELESILVEADDNNNTQLRITISDITERKQTEEALHQSHTLLSSIIESPKQIIILSLDRDYRYTAFNEVHANEMKRVWGVDIELGKRILDYIPGDEDREKAERNYERVIKGEPLFQIEEYGEPGNRFSYELTYNPILDEKANVVGLTLFIFDVSENKRAEEALRESEEKYRSMMESMKDAAYICSLEFRIEYMNPRMISRIGRDAVGELCHKAIYDRNEKCSWCVFDQIQQGEHVEYELANPKDNHYYSISNSPILHFDGSISKLTIFRDITESKSIEAQLHQARKMESIGTIAGGIAHDFNNLLYMIVGNTELALEDIPEWNPTHANLEEVKAASLRAAGIVKQLLNFSRKSAQKLIPVGAITIIKDALKFMRSTIPTTVEIRKNLPDMDITIMADSIQINQILMNLCTNASQAMEETGGTIDIVVENESLKESSGTNYPDLTAGEYVKITVSDTGPGIDSEVIGRIFDPYFTTKEVGKGSGMGLAVVHGLVKNHNGAITVDSEPGKGATFTILFPVIDERPEIEVKIPEEVPLGNETILFVDDEKSIAQMIGQMLKRLGYKVETKLNPVEAIELFKADPEAFDLVITDMTMPQMTGIKLSEKLKEIRPDIPVIISTGHSSLIDEEKAKAMGIDGYVMKPIMKSEIAIAIRKVLDI